MGICDSAKKNTDLNIKKDVSIPKKPNPQTETTCVVTNQEIKNNLNESIARIDNIPAKGFPIKIHADINEVQYPIYVEKGQELCFTIIKGEWMFLPEYGKTNYEGHSQLKYKDINVGALLFKVLGGASFYITDNLKYKADSTGPLIFFANYDRNESNFYFPQGEIEVNIKGGVPMSQEKIDELCGWKIGKIESKDISPTEKELFYYINKIRTSPQLFGKLYKNQLMTAENAETPLESILDKFTPLPELTYNASLTKAAIDHADDIGKNGTTGHISTNNSTIKNRIEKYEKNFEYFGENCCFNVCNSLAIAIDMIVDNNLADKFNQNNILNPSFTDVGLCLRKHQSFKWCCVILFGKQSSHI